MSTGDGTQPAPLGVAVVGFGWMARAHTQAYLRVLHHFPALGLRPRLVSAVDDVPGRAEAAARQFGFASAGTDWHAVLDDPGVQAVSITAPNWLHREIAVAMAEAGKHIWLEKPAGLGLQDTTAIAEAVRANAVQSTIGFNYRNAPAVVAAREMVRNGTIGRVTHARFQLFSDYAAHPEGALTWRYQLERGGRGVVGDLGSHGVDLVRFVLGEVGAVMADTAIFVPERAVPTGPTEGHARVSGGAMGRVENEDYLGCLLRMRDGARVVLEACRVSVGEQNNYGFQVHGTEGALYWDFRRMGELGTSLGKSFQDQPVCTAYVGPGAGEYGAFQPGSGIAMSYDDLKVVECYNFLRSVAKGRPHGATIEDALRAAEVLEAALSSADSGTWAAVASGPA